MMSLANLRDEARGFNRFFPKRVAGYPDDGMCGTLDIRFHQEAVMALAIMIKLIPSVLLGYRVKCVVCCLDIVLIRCVD
jgi:hypothetical protein